MSDDGVAAAGATGGRGKNAGMRRSAAPAERAKPGRGKAARRRAEALARDVPLVSAIDAFALPEPAAAADASGPEELLIGTAGMGDSVRETAEMEMTEPDTAFAEPGEYDAEPMSGAPEPDILAEAGAAMADDGVEIEYLEDGMLETEMDAMAEPAAGESAAGESAPVAGAHILPERCGSSAAHDLVAVARTLPAGSRFLVDAAVVGRMSCAMVVSLVSAAKTAAAGGGALVIRAPSNAFTDAFSDLGLFEALMNMEFAE